MNVTINPNVPLTAAQAKARYRWTEIYRNGKPVFQIPTRAVISRNGAFVHKKLCDGPTFTLGLSCAFTCSFCYVEAQLARHPAILRIMKETGLHFDQIVVEKEDPLHVLKRELLKRDGRPKYGDPTDTRVVFASPLVDVAANKPTAQMTIEACKVILENTHWQIRLLSKSAALQSVAAGLTDYKVRVIYGLSTGTFNDRLAASFEQGTSSPSARLRALHWLQDNGYRTYAMICPSLPQEDYHEFARHGAQAVRADRCEHVWAEVLNVRGNSLRQTTAALRGKGFMSEASMLERVSSGRQAWEEYARATFLAHSNVVPLEKLRFLQYVQRGQLNWWREHAHLGAVLLGSNAVSTEPADLADDYQPTILPPNAWQGTN